LVGASAGFLPFNWARASVFLGDVGSYFLGYVLAVLPLLAPSELRSQAALFVAVSLWLFLADATWTLAARALRGERLYEAHREHLYQRLSQRWGHAKVTTAIGAGSVVLTAAALLWWRSQSPRWAWAALGLGFALFAAEWSLARAASPAPKAAVRWPALRGFAGGRRLALILGLDALLICSSFYAASLLRFDGQIPSEHLQILRRFLPLFLAIRLSLHLAFGLHRWSFRLSGFYEAVRVVIATAVGTVAFVAVFYFLQTPGPPRSVLAMEFFLTASLVGAFRFSPRLANNWLLAQSRLRSGLRIRTLIVGAGSAGDLLLRDLLRSEEHSYDVVGFVDDDRSKWGQWIGGQPVLGPIDDLPSLAKSRDVRQLLFAIPRLPAARLREILAACSSLKLSYKILPVSFAYLNDHVRLSMLHDLSPDHLLPRHEVRFDEQELDGLIRGRRILVTGAAGSIGSEACRQIAGHAPASLVLADIDENNLYFLFRYLRQQYPGLAVEAQVVDIRDAQRLDQLGRRYRPQDVIHAAAHKHVPLMEYAPEEAVKNNVVGCLNVVVMADALGAERFVLVSTDKAVNPASVMGASKRVAELIVQDRAIRSRTRFATVRFGNVLGSAGSVVPLFKEQIGRGGPVTVTHPECRRYLMTIPEAVGLLLLAGLGGHGELLILEMGEPIRILDLARMMIALAGRVAEADVKIEFTGLRPGEKLDEQLMTAEEAVNSYEVRPKVRAVRSAPAPPDLMERIGRLEALAREGSRERLLEALREAVPGFAPAPRVALTPSGSR
jgi:FlaA1/EpsC-like NDP-sugar epimerase